jgi:hypothetical protein
MNPRIRELAIESGGRGLQMSTVGLSLLGEDCIEKFAELLIRECMDVVKDCDVTEYNDFREGISQEITKHFGVEE